MSKDDKETDYFGFPPYLFLRATPTGVVIRGVIPITAKMTPQQQKIRLQRWWQNAIEGFRATPMGVVKNGVPNAILQP